VPGDVRDQEIERTEALIERLEGLVVRAGGDRSGTDGDPALTRLVETLEVRREEVEELYEEVRKERDRHGVGWIHRKYKPYDKLGPLFGTWGPAREGEAYEEAERIFREAEEHGRAADSL
jgi:hypothetical protein